MQLDLKRLTPKKFKKKYDQGTMPYQGKDPHDDNKWEKLRKSTKRIQIEMQDF